MNTQSAWRFTTLNDPGVIILLVGLSILLLGLCMIDLRQKNYKLAFASFGLRLGVVLWLALYLFGLTLWHDVTEPAPGHYTIVVDRTASTKLNESDQAITQALEQLNKVLSPLGTVETRFYWGGQTPWENTTKTLYGSGPSNLIFDLTQFKTAQQDQAVIVLTDGADTSPDVVLTPPASHITAVLLPEKVTLPPLRLKNVQTDAYALVRSPLRFYITLVRDPKQISYAQVEILNQGQPLATTDVIFTDQEEEKTITLDVLPKQEGTELFQIVIKNPPQPITEFSETWQAIRVLRDKIRVLHVVGQPDWESRLVRQLLQNNLLIDLVSFQILRTREDNPQASENELSLIPFPTRELFTNELAKFDIVIFQDFDYRPYFEHVFAKQLLNNLKEFVDKQGGGFLMTAGEQSFGFARYEQTPLADILPVSWQPLSRWQKTTNTPQKTSWQPWFAAELPDGNYITRIYPSTLKPQAKAIWQTTAGPLLALKDVGQGHTAALLTDQFWQIYHHTSAQKRAQLEQAWLRLMLYLAGDPSFANLHVTWQPEHALPGQDVSAIIQTNAGTQTLKQDQPVILLNAQQTPVTQTTLNQQRANFTLPPTQQGFYIQIGQDKADQPLIAALPMIERTELEPKRQKWQDWANQHHVLLASLSDWQTTSLLEKLQQHAQTIISRDILPIYQFSWFWFIGLFLILADLTLRRLFGQA